MTKATYDPHLFTVRVWLEEIHSGGHECRGRVQYGLDGPSWHFQGWAAMIDFMQGMVQSAQEEEGGTDQGRDNGAVAKY